MAYQEKLLNTKEYYPFANWRESYGHGLEQYTPENCDLAKRVFDTLINELITIGEAAPEPEKVKCFEIAILALNELNDEIYGLIETGEREDLCELIDQITLAAGLDPADYADGDGIADQWRDW